MARRSGGRLSAWALLAVVVLGVLAGIPRFASSRGIDVDRIHLTDQPNGWYLDYEGTADISGYSFDTYSYVAYVDYIRGDFHRYPIYGPWRWRALPSWIAAQLPIDDAATAFAAVSLAFGVVGAACVVLIAARRRSPPSEQFLAGALLALSFPMVWYGTSGYVDISLVGMLAIALLFVERKWWLPFLLLVPLGMMTKETFVIIIPVAAVSLWAESHRPRHWIPVPAAASVLAVATFLVARLLWTTPRTLGWMPTFSRFMWNTTRPPAIGSFVLTCGVVLPLALIEIRRLYRSRNDGGEGAAAWASDLHLVVGTGLGLLVALHGFMTAYADGRHAWTIYPFAAVLAARAATRSWSRWRRHSTVVVPSVDDEAASRVCRPDV